MGANKKSISALKKYNRVVSIISRWNKQTNAGLDIAEVRGYASQIYPNFRETGVSGITKKSVLPDLFRLFLSGEDAPKKGRAARCGSKTNIFKNNPLDFITVDWFGGNYLVEVYMASNTDFKFDAGDQYGDTGIINKDNYNYDGDLKPIVERIREDAENDSGEFYWRTELRVKPGCKDNGKSGSYYLNIVLFYDETPFSDNWKDFGMPTDMGSEEHDEAIRERKRKIRRERRRKKKEQKPPPGRPRPSQKPPKEERDKEQELQVLKAEITKMEKSLEVADKALKLREAGFTPEQISKMLDL